MTVRETFDSNIEAALRNAFNAASAAYESIDEQDSFTDQFRANHTRDKIEELLNENPVKNPENVYENFNQSEELYARIGQILIWIETDKECIRDSGTENSEAIDFLEKAAVELSRAQQRLDSEYDTSHVN